MRETETGERPFRLPLLRECTTGGDSDDWIGDKDWAAAREFCTGEVPTLESFAKAPREDGAEAGETTRDEGGRSRDRERNEPLEPAPEGDRLRTLTTGVPTGVLFALREALPLSRVLVVMSKLPLPVMRRLLLSRLLTILLLLRCMPLLFTGGKAVWTGDNI